MNEALKQKRDELAKQFQADDDMYPKSGPANSFRMGFDAALKAVTEIIGEFEQSEVSAVFLKELPVNNEETGRLLLAHLQMLGAKWQHAEIMKKLEGEK